MISSAISRSRLIKLSLAFTYAAERQPIFNRLIAKILLLEGLYLQSFRAYDHSACQPVHPGFSNLTTTQDAGG